MGGERNVFEGDTLERRAAKGTSPSPAWPAGNDVIILATSKGWAIRPDFGADDFDDFDLSGGRVGDQAVHRVFVDPGGSHCIVTVLCSTGAEVHYIHSRWGRPRILSKLKGVVVNCTAWNRQQITEASTREIMLGTDSGQLYEMAVDEKDKKEKYMKLLLELSKLPEAFSGLQLLGDMFFFCVKHIIVSRIYLILPVAD